MSLSCTAVAFEKLSGSEVHALARLRQDVFVVEQACPYPDLDGRDVAPGTRHVLLSSDGLLIGCARVLDDGDDWRVGRVALARDARGQGLADLLMRTALAVTAGRDVVLDAQAPLAGWYATHGFEISGAEFLEDGIPHLPMRRPQASR
ncbi:MAG: GNAT family N-acetyltransferase [Nocardioides sp.]